LIDKLVEYLQVDFRGAYSERITLYYFVLSCYTVCFFTIWLDLEQHRDEGVVTVTLCIYFLLVLNCWPPICIISQGLARSQLYANYWFPLLSAYAKQKDPVW